jgi:hypothetical protein
MRATLFALAVLVATDVLATEPEIAAIRFEKCPTEHTCVPLERWREDAGAPSQVRVLATVRNVDSYADEFFLLTTTQYLIAPVYSYSIADVDKLRSGNEISWGQLTRDNDMRSIVVRNIRRGSQRDIELRRINLRGVLQGSFSDPSDYLWPWLVRVNAVLLNREGNIVSKGASILELEPSAKRIRSVPTK